MKMGHEGIYMHLYAFIYFSFEGCSSIPEMFLGWSCYGFDGGICFMEIAGNNVCKMQT